MIHKYSLFALFVVVLQRFHEQLANTESLFLGEIEDLKCSGHTSMNWSTHLCLTCFLFKDTCRCVTRNLWRTPQEHVPNTASLTHIFRMRYITESFHLGALDCTSMPLGFHSKRINHQQSTRKWEECSTPQTVEWQLTQEGFKAPTTVRMSATDWREPHDCRVYLQVWGPQTMAICTYTYMLPIIYLKSDQ